MLRRENLGHKVLFQFEQFAGHFPPAGEDYNFSPSNSSLSLYDCQDEKMSFARGSAWLEEFHFWSETQASPKLCGRIDQ